MLRYGRDRLPLKKAFNTAIGMSMVSMLAMEMAENATNYYLTGGVVVFQDVTFWLSAMVSLLAGFMAPLPYNYIRLKKFGKSCH